MIKVSAAESKAYDEMNVLVKLNYRCYRVFLTNYFTRSDRHPDLNKSFQTYDVVASSVEEANQVVIDNNDAILDFHCTTKSAFSDTFLNPKYADPVFEINHVTSTISHTTDDFFHTPLGFLKLKLKNGFVTIF